jgi:hypothetical protein
VHRREPERTLGAVAIDTVEDMPESVHHGISQLIAGHGAPFEALPEDGKNERVETLT